MQCACAVLSFVASPALQYVSTLSHKRHDLGGGGWGELVNIKRVFRDSLQLLSETFLILGRTERDIIRNVYDHHVQSIFNPYRTNVENRVSS